MCIINNYVCYPLKGYGFHIVNIPALKLVFITFAKINIVMWSEDQNMVVVNKTKCCN